MSTQLRAGARQRALKAVALMRKGTSLTRAAKRSKTSPNTIRKYARSALGDIAGGRYQAARSDQLTRALRLVDENGQFTVHVRSSRSATLIAEYWNAVKRYLTRGHTDQLKRFAGKSVRSRGQMHRLLTDPATLARLASVGEGPDYTIYDHTTT
jgi:hypothetical protein